MFQDFIVLGIIPGTNLQISFQQWLIAVLLGTLAYYYRTHTAQVHMWLMIWRIRLTIKAGLLEVR